MIQNGDFIKLTYTGRIDDETGEVFDTTDEEIARDNNIFNEDYTYGGEKIIVGAGHTLKGLEEELIGKEAGHTGTITLPPEKGFGSYNPSLIRSYPVNKFKDKPTVGMQVQVDGQYGIVHRVIGRRVQIDFNSPMAGKTLHYTYTIDEKIEDNTEKAKGLAQLYTKENLDVTIENETATIDIPMKIAYTPQWVMSKRNLAEDIIKYTNVKQVIFTETYNENNIQINN